MTVTIYVIPSIGSRGYYSLKDPLSNLIEGNVPYTCQSIRTLGEWVASGGDALTDIYLKAGLTEADYESDLAESMKIAGLQSDAGLWAYVPVKYLKTYPIQNGIGYCTMMLGVTLGAIPKTVDLDPVIASIKNTVYNFFGNDPVVNPVQVSKEVVISREDSDKIETARQARISMNMSDSARVLVLQKQNEELSKKLAALEGYIKKHYVP